MARIGKAGGRRFDEGKSYKRPNIYSEPDSRNEWGTILNEDYGDIDDSASTTIEDDDKKLSHESVQGKTVIVPGRLVGLEFQDKPLGD